jgi:toxin YoeB
MKYKITIEEEAQKHISYFKKHDKVIVKKIQNLLYDIIEHPFEGIGKPEPLKFELLGYWSRRITREHRVFYKVKKDEVIVLICRYHY